MLRWVFGNRIASTIWLIIIVVAVWKYNDGDIARIVDVLVNAVNAAADFLIRLWTRVFG